MAEGTASSSAAHVYKPRYVIEKLNGTNYQVWKLRMELYLKQMQLWDIISGDEPQPVIPSEKAPQDAYATALKEWKIKDINAQTELIGHCADRQVQMVRNMSTARAIWNFFAQSYEHTDLIYQVSLIKRLVNSNMNEGQSTTKFLDSWQALLDEVLISGLAIPETLQAMLLLAALPSSWRAFITTQATVENLQLQGLVSKIQQEETLREQTTGSEKSVALATTAKRSHNERHKANHQAYGNNHHKQCNFCHRFGHLERDCRTKRRQQGSSIENNSNLSPYGYHYSPNPHNQQHSYSETEQGHQYNTTPYNQQDIRPTAHAQYAEISNYEGHSEYKPLQLYATTIGTNKPSNLWFLDTGATHHMTHALDYLSNIKYLNNPIEVCLADNSTQLAQAIGDAVIQAPRGQQITISNVYYVPRLQNSFASVSMLTSIGITVLFKQNACELFGVFPREPMACITCPRQGRLYPLGHTARAATEEFPLPQPFLSQSSPPINHTQALQNSPPEVSQQPDLPHKFPLPLASTSFKPPTALM